MTLTLSGIFLFSLLFFAVVFQESDWQAVSTDTVNMGWAIEKFEKTGELQPFWISNQGFDPASSQEPVYPLIQRIVAALTPESFGGISGLIFVTWIVTSLLPVGVALIVRQIHPDPLAMIAGAVLTTGSLSVVRAAFVTPQNIFGYAGMLVGTFFVIRFLQKGRLWDALGSLGSVILVAALHPLSAVVFGMTVVFVLLRWLGQRVGVWAVAGASVLALMVLVWFVGGWGNPLEGFIYHVAARTFGSAGQGLYYPFWELPVAVGFLLTLLTIYALGALGKEIPSAVKTYFWIATIPALLLSQSYWMGFDHELPDRFVAYLWIPFVLVAVFGAEMLVKEIGWAEWKWKEKGVLLFFVFFAIFIPVFRHAQSDILGFGAVIRLNDDYKESFEWMRDFGDSTKNVLTATYSDREKVLYLPFYFDGKITRYTSSNFQSSPNELIGERTVVLAPLGTFLESLFPEVYQKINRSIRENTSRETDVFNMMVHPDDPLAQKTMDEFNIQYAWLDRSGYETTFFEQSKIFDPVFRNNTVVIYARKNN